MKILIFNKCSSCWLLAKDIDKDRFNNIVSRINKELNIVNNEIEILGLKTDSIKSDIESGLELLMNLQEFFVNSNYEGKRILAGAVFSEKLIFGNENCRTTKVNEVIEVLTRDIKASEGIKKRKAVKNDSFSVNVPFTVELSNLFVEDLKKLSMHIKS